MAACLISCVARRLPALVTIFAGLAMAQLAMGQEIKIASIAPDGSSWMRAMRAGAEEIEERTSGRISMRFYPGGVMGDDAQILRRIRVGQLQGGAFTAGGLSSRYPGLSLYGIPLLFRSLDEVDYVRERLDPVLMRGLEAAGFTSFGFVEGGFAQLMSNEPIQTVSDMARRKVWIPEGDQISFLALQSLGVSPVVLPITDVLTGLQTGLLDVVASSPVAALVLQWHTRVRYITDLPVVYSMGLLAIDAAILARTSAEDRAILREVLRRTVNELDHAAREDNKRALEVMYDIGIEPVTVDPSNVGPWRATVETIYPELRQRDDIDAELLDRLLALLEEYRAKGSVAAETE
jgi:TRAP-type C4-dicarboxylate transport system substrate-binding protein